MTCPNCKQKTRILAIPGPALWEAIAACGCIKVSGWGKTDKEARDAAAEWWRLTPKGEVLFWV